jgi:cytochrome c oxidase assembly protein subunit 15
MTNDQARMTNDQGRMTNDQARMTNDQARMTNDQSFRTLVIPSGSSRLLRLSLVTASVVYVQVVLGALLRHVPPGASPQFFRAAVWFHLLLAAAVFVHAVLVARVVIRGFRQESLLVWPAAILLGLVLVQLLLGVGTWVLKYGWPTWFSEMPFAAGHTIEANSLSQGIVATAHMAVGALILSQAVVLSLRAARVTRPAMWSVGSGAILVGWST